VRVGIVREDMDRPSGWIKTALDEATGATDCVILYRHHGLFSLGTAHFHRMLIRFQP
jgi:hypothetical protein